MATIRRSPAVPADPGRLLAQAKLDAFCPQRVGDQLADPRILAVDQPLGALDDRHLGPVAAKHLPELDPDRPAAENDHVAGNL